jgi:L-threonylcarbamoyladenylate synthase
VTARIVPDGPDGRAAAVEALRAGGVVALPTDTVYGICVALETPGGVERLYEIKRRPPDKGIMLLLESAGQASRIGMMTPGAVALAGACWPGGLTVRCRSVRRRIARRADRRNPTIGLRA